MYSKETFFAVNCLSNKKAIEIESNKNVLRLSLRQFKAFTGVFNIPNEYTIYIANADSVKIR